MADTSAIISSSGGIAAGSPFTLGAVLAVQQVSPPVAFTARLAFLADAEESIVAPGVLGGVTTFVIGRQVIDNGATGAILIALLIYMPRGMIGVVQNFLARIYLPGGLLSGIHNFLVRIYSRRET